MKVWILNAFCISVLLLTFRTAYAQQDAQQEAHPIAVLVNQSVNIDTLSSAQLRMIFAGRTQFWPDGSRIRVFVLPPDNPTHQHFCRELLNIYPYQLERIWQRVVYSGQGEAPVIVRSVAELTDKLAQTRGAIGYIAQPSQPMENINMITVGAQP